MLEPAPLIPGIKPIPSHRHPKVWGGEERNLQFFTYPSAAKAFYFLHTTCSRGGGGGAKNTSLNWFGETAGLSFHMPQGVEKHF